MNKQERAAEFLIEVESRLKQAEATSSAPYNKIKSINLENHTLPDFPISLRTIGDETVVVRADVKISPKDVHESLQFVMGVRVELAKIVPDEKRLRNAFVFYRDKIPPQIFRAVSSAIVTSGLGNIAW